MSNTEKSEKVKKTLGETRERRKSQTCKVYRLKIQENKLNLKQKEQLKMVFVEAKRIWNSMLGYSAIEGNNIFDYNNTKSVVILDKDKNVVEKSLEFLGSQIKQSVIQAAKDAIINLAKAREKGYKIGGLKYKSRFETVDLKQYNTTYRIKSQTKVKIQGISGYLKVNGMGQLNAPNIEYANAKLICNAEGYFLSITTYQSKEVERPTKLEIGIDLGCATTLTTSEGEEVTVLVEETERLKKLQRQLEKKKKGSNNRYKHVLIIRKEYLRIGHKKDDEANKVIHDLLKHKKIYMQDENLVGWKSQHGKKVQHSILGRIKRKLINHDRVITLKQFVPTTQFCPKCENKTKHDRSKRVYLCSHCGHTEHRDVHAAKNMIILAMNPDNIREKKKKLGVGCTKYTPVDIKLPEATGWPLGQKSKLMVEAGSPIL